jgi:subfamily B ATP-binding cassette protein MsbA
MKEKDSKVKLLGNIIFVGQVLGPGKKTALLVCLVILLAALVESFGLSMILPILQVVVEGDLQGRLALILDPLVSQFPHRLLFPVLCLLFLLLIVLKSAFTLIRIFVTKRFVWQIRLQWLKRIFKKYLGAEYAFILNHKQGELLNNLISETHRGAICLSQLTEYLAKVVLLSVLYVTLMLVNWQATLILSIAIGSLLLVTHQVSKNFAQRTGRRRIRLNQQLSSGAAESIGAVRQIKVFGIGNWFYDQFYKIARKLSVVEIRLDVVRAISLPLGETVIGFLLVGGVFYLYFYTDIVLKSFLPTLGVLVVIGQRLVNNISNLAAMRIQILSLLPSVSLSHSLSEEFIAQENISTGDEFKELKQDIVFQDVTFSYGKGHPVLLEWSMVIPRGKMTALVGPSGSGKSTVTDLLLGLFQPQSGQILLNGKGLPEWKLSSWRQKVGYVSQDILLFNMSIRDNIALGDLEAAEEAIINAAKTAYAHDFIVNLPDGYDTVVGDRGLKLSGGQRQRIAIARAIIRNPDFLIFDEATSALDNESERLIQKAIEKISKEKTILIIAHRLSTIENADVVYDLGKMKAESGMTQENE